jgi:HPt (histidine-containing phosphotransfer) domain-containing protein
MRDHAAINLALFDDLRANTEDDPVFLAELIDTYLADSTELVARLHETLAAADLEGFHRAAHSLKTNSATLGAEGLAALARELEMGTRAGSLDGAIPRLAALEDEYRWACAGLAALRPAA